jgi:DNA-binding IclR family transcriptional regulator
LRLIGEHQEAGMTLTEIVERSGLERSTAHRLLSCLVEERFIDKDRERKAYRLGLESMQLGLSSMKRIPLVVEYQSLMKKLARITGETIFLQIREGDYGVCLHRENGSASSIMFETEVWVRWLLGIGAGGLAMMANLSDGEIDEIYKRHQAEYKERGMSREKLHRAVARTRRLGYSEIRDMTTPGVSGIGFAFRAAKSTIASISLGTITAKLPEVRKQMLASEIQSHLREVAELISAD